MLEVDLHSHSLYSGCGVHTVLELLEAASKRGIKVLAITDHGTELKSSINSVFYERFINPFKDIKLLKGMECNPIDASGLIDLPSKFLPFMDVVLCGLHHNIKENLGAKKYTDMMIAANKSNPAIDIITHPDDSSYPMQFERLAKVAKENGVALELNNSKILLKRVEPNRTRELIKACKNVGCHGCQPKYDTHAGCSLCG